MRFQVRRKDEPIPGQLVYIVSDHALSFESSVGRVANLSGSASVAIDTLEIFVLVTAKRAVGLSGYFPREGWRDARLAEPHATPGSLMVDFEKEVDQGEVYGLSSAATWLREYDRTTGWLRTGAAKAEAAQLVEFLSGVIAGVRGDDLVELWMRPAVR